MAVTYKPDLNGWAQIYTYDSTLGTFSANLYNSTTFDYFNNNAVVGDIIYIAGANGNESVWDSALFYVGTAMAGTGIVITPEYWNGSAWVTVVDYQDDTNGFTTLGANRVYWDIIKQTGWTQTSINGLNLAWIRFRITALTTITEGGAQSTQRVYRRQDRYYVANYISTAPATFADLYTADKAGTLDLKIRTGISATDTSAVNSVYSLRPADEIIMGGTKNDLYLTVANFTGVTSVTVQLAGADASGTAQTEDIIITANGQYNSTKIWKTLTTTQVTSVTGTGTFDYTLTQGQWGITWNDKNWYKIDRPILLSNTYFEDNSIQVVIDEQLYHNSNGISIFYFDNSVGLTYITFGTIIDEAKKSTSNGIEFFYNNIILGYASFIYLKSGHTRLYSCTFTSQIKRDVTSSISTHTSSVSQSRIWNCVFKKNFQCGLSGSSSNVDIFNLTVGNNSTIIRRPDPTDKIEKLSGNSISYCVWYQNYGGFVKDLWAVNGDYVARIQDVGTNDTFVVNFDIDSWLVNWAGTNSGNLYRQNSLKLRVCDKNGNMLQNARVIFSKTGETTFEALTNSSGDIVDSTFTRSDGSSTTTSVGKLIDSSATFITNGVRKGQYVFNKGDNTFTYVTSVDSETQLTLRDDKFVSGDTYFVEECILTYGTYDSVNGSVLQNNSDWNIEVIRAGFKKHKGVLVIDSERDTTILLTKPILNLSNSVRIE